MLKKITGSILTIMLMTTMFLGAFSVAAPEPVHAAGGGINVTASYGGTTYTIVTNGSIDDEITLATIKSIINVGTMRNQQSIYSADGSALTKKDHTTLKIASTGTGSIAFSEENPPKKTAISVGFTVTQSHTHTWNNSSYSASGNKITATCKGTVGTCPLAQPTLTLNASGKTYDGSEVTATASGNSTWTTANGLPAISSSNITYSPANSKNAGTYEARYTVGNATAKQSFTISPREATLNWTDTELTYNGTNQKPKATVSNLVSGDTCNVTVTGEKKDAGQSYTATATELSNSNYALPSSRTTTFKINRKALTLTGVTANSKTYDGNTTADLNKTDADLDGIIGQDDVSIGTITGVYTGENAKNVGTNKPIEVTVTLTGEDADNYEVTPLNLKADITAKEVTVPSGIIASAKRYNRGTDATLDCKDANIVGKIDGDDLSVTATGAFRDKNVAEDKPVDISGHTLTGAAAGNYKLADSGNQTVTTATITPQPLEVSGITASNKKYDGGTSATVDASKATYTGKLGDDDVDVDFSSVEGNFADKNVGTDKPIAFTFNVTGTDAGNYIAKPATTITADITAKPVKVSGITVDTRQYDKTTDAPLNTGNATFGGIETGDVLTVSGTGTYTDNANVGVNKPVSITGLTLGGTDKDNYSVSDDSQNTETGTVTKRDIKVSGITAEDKTYDGKTDATLVFTGVQLGGNLDGENLQLAQDHFTGAFDTEGAGTGKTVNISISEPDKALSGTAAGNYKLADEGQQTTAEAAINKAKISVTADNKISQYKHALEDLTYQVSGGYVEGDDLGVQLSTTASRTAVPGDYPIEVSWNENPNYTATLTDGTYTITKANATITVSGYEGVYDGKEHSIAVDVEDKGGLEALLDLVKSFFGENNEKAEATVYYSDKTELTAENYETEGSLENPSYRNASDNTVYYYIVLSDHYKTEDEIAGSKDVKIAKAPLTVTADPKTKTYGEEDPKLTYKVEGTIEGEEDLIKVELERESGEAKGTYKIKDKSITATDNYAVTYVPADFVIKPASEDGKIDEETINRNDPPETAATNLDKIVNSLLTEEERQAMKDGAKVRIWVEVTGLRAGDVPSDDRDRLDAAASELGLTAGRWMDISLYKEVTGFGVTQLHDIDVPIELLTEVPAELRKDGRVFYILRCHNGIVSTLAETTSNSISYESDGFSTYMLAYKDPEKPVNPDDSKGSKGSGDSNGSNKSKGSKGSKGTNTGDPNDIAGLIALMLASGGALGAMGCRRRKER